MPEFFEEKRAPAARNFGSSAGKPYLRATLFPTYRTPAMFLQALFVVLHVLMAAAWFGLTLRLGAQTRLLLKLDHDAATTVAENLDRGIREIGIFLLLAFVFGLGAFVTGGPANYGPNIHTGMLLVLIMLALHYLGLRPQWRAMRHALQEDRTDAAALAQRKISMFTGIGHLLWVTVFILMFWHRLTAGM